jgi:hypothetical protein
LFLLLDFGQILPIFYFFGENFSQKFTAIEHKFPENTSFFSKCEMVSHTLKIACVAGKSHLLSSVLIERKKPSDAH